MQVVLTSLSSSGTGKTTAFAHIAYLVSLAGFTVRIIELDSRNSLRKCCGLPIVDPSQSTSVIFEDDFDGNYPFAPLWQEHLMGGAQILQVDRKAQRQTSDKLTSQTFGALALKKILKKHPIDCDLLILDCPGEQNVISESAILASTHLLLGIECSSKCFEDVENFLTRLYYLRDEWEFPIPVLSGFLIGKFNLQAGYQRQAIKDLVPVAEGIKCNLFNPIRYSPYYLNSYAAGLPIHIYAPSFAGGSDFSQDGNFFRRENQGLDSFEEGFKYLPAIVPYLIDVLRDKHTGVATKRSRTTQHGRETPGTAPLLVEVV